MQNDHEGTPNDPAEVEKKDKELLVDHKKTHRGKMTTKSIKIGLKTLFKKKEKVR